MQLRLNHGQRRLKEKNQLNSTQFNSTLFTIVGTNTSKKHQEAVATKSQKPSQEAVHVVIQFSRKKKGEVPILEQ
jgi:hypothetical protein